jgi:hypothetical protein
VHSCTLGKADWVQPAQLGTDCGILACITGEGILPICAGSAETMVDYTKHSISLEEDYAQQHGLASTRGWEECAPESAEVMLGERAAEAEKMSVSHLEQGAQDVWEDECVPP